MNHCAPVSMSLFLWYIWLPSLPLTVGAWLFVLRFLGRKSGWSDLAEVYGEVRPDAFGDPSVWLAGAYVGPVRHYSSLNLSTAAGGLAVRGWGPFRPWHPPLFIPKGDLEAEPVDRVSVDHRADPLDKGNYVRIVSRRRPDVPIHITASAARRLRLLADFPHERDA